MDHETFMRRAKAREFAMNCTTVAILAVVAALIWMGGQ